MTLKGHIGAGNFSTANMSRNTAHVADEANDDDRKSHASHYVYCCIRAQEPRSRSFVISAAFSDPVAALQEFFLWHGPFLAFPRNRLSGFQFLPRDAHSEELNIVMLKLSVYRPNVEVPWVTLRVITRITSQESSLFGAQIPPI